MNVMDALKTSGFRHDTKDLMGGFARHCDWLEENGLLRYFEANILNVLQNMGLLKDGAASIVDKMSPFLKFWKQACKHLWDSSGRSKTTEVRRSVSGKATTSSISFWKDQDGSRSSVIPYLWFGAWSVVFPHFCGRPPIGRGTEVLLLSHRYSNNSTDGCNLYKETSETGPRGL